MAGRPSAAVLIAFSRLYLYVHFPSDVLGGAVLGVGIGLLMLYGSGGLQADASIGPYSDEMTVFVRVDVRICPHNAKKRSRSSLSLS